MARIRVIPPQDAAGELKEAYARTLKKRGAIANVHAIHSLAPRTMETHIDFYVSVLFGPSGLSRRERETIAVSVSQANACEYCVVHHADALSRYQKDARILSDLRARGNSAALSPREKALVAYARKLTQDPTRMGQADVDALRKVGLDDEEILTGTLTAAYFNFVNRVVLALGVDVEPTQSPSYKY